MVRRKKLVIRKRKQREPPTVGELGEIDGGEPSVVAELGLHDGGEPITAGELGVNEGGERNIVVEMGLHDGGVREVAEDEEVDAVADDEREAVADDDDCEAIVDDSSDEFVDETGQNGVEEDACDEIRVDEEAVTKLPAGLEDFNEQHESDDSGNDDLWKEEKIPEPLSSDDEGEEAAREAREDAAPEHEILALGKTFSSAAEFKQALLRYSLKTKYDIKLFLSTQRKLAAVCSGTSYDCKWRVYCSYERSKHKLQIKVYVNKHTCIRSGFSKMLKSSSIAELFTERLRINPKFKALDISEEIERDYKLTVTEDQCRKAKTKITRERRAAHMTHFSRIWDYQAAVLENNPGTSIDIETISGSIPRQRQRFDRFYVCFEAQRTAWKSTCRPIIGLDGAFLKWDVKGQLVAAVGRDGDNRIVPIAWAVVEIENDDKRCCFWSYHENRLNMKLSRICVEFASAHLLLGSIVS